MMTNRIEDIFREALPGVMWVAEELGFDAIFVPKFVSGGGLAEFVEVPVRTVDGSAVIPRAILGSDSPMSADMARRVARGMRSGIIADMRSLLGRLEAAEAAEGDNDGR